MNPSNPFGQGGAFQSPNNTMKSGLFPSFGQQNSSNQPQSVGFFQPSAFGQPTVLNQPSPHGTIFGQAPAFGQSSAQPPAINQAPAFGQQSLGMSSSGFGGGTVPAFGQTRALNQGSVFGQTPAFGQSPAFGQNSAFGQQTPEFGKQPSTFGSSQMATVATTTLGQPQPLGFGQPAFGAPSSTSVSTSMFGAGQNVTQSRGFGSSDFSFKPANEALFKPIFSASPEPTNPQSTSMSSSPFIGSGSQTSSSTMSSSTSTSGFSMLSGAKSGPLGFSFSQPAAAPSISAQSDPLTTGSSSGPTNTLQFTFSQPAAPSSSSTKTSTTEPTTPSSFSFTAKTLQSQSATLFGGPGFGQPSAFGEIKAKADTDDKGGSLAGSSDINISARFGKATKRKDDSPATSMGQEKSAAEEDVPPESDLPRHPPKRPLMRSRGPTGGLFSRALTSLRRDFAHPVKREALQETQQEAAEWEETQGEEVQALGGDLSVTPSVVQITTRDVLEKVEESDSAKTPDPKLETTTPVRCDKRRESLESLSGMSPTDCTVIQCRNIPPPLNKKDILEKHFSLFGNVRKVFCRPAKNLAIVHFGDHASAAKAKKKGKILHRQELLLLWQKKKQSPGDKQSRPIAAKEETKAESTKDTESKAVSSPLRRPPALSSTITFNRSSPVKNTSLARSLQFDTEPQKEISTETQTLDCTVPSTLLPLIGQLAETAEDKYRLLEQRDKILRQGRPKRTDLDLSKVFVGTCPDMCPEKERYMRETRNQLSVFEVIPNTEMVDHTAAIKEYSRSSADQEEPLPHELRPLPVLGMTMDYLVTQIMDQGHDNYRDWYDFVWNRTRGIRKDITQQHLCCPRTVSLIEKCTRFHVHCAHHLCEEHISSFDAKINNENMTKCLQSLKEMYQDLAARQIFCAREAEFRQYNVLLKLNDGDILREVQQFRDEVRNSPEVKFAVQAFTAVNSNNFVRFFKLVKGASYLSSCLLHRYFNQVRAKALKTLNMAHTVGPRSTAFPLEDIVRMLMFRSAVEATDFIQHYGLNVSDSMVELSRIAYQEPELPLSQKKSEVILAKKAMLVGEVVNGGPLPNPHQHTPVCSFDSQNKFRGEAPMAEPIFSQFKTMAKRVEVKAPPSEVLPPAVTSETGEPSESYQASPQPPDHQQLFQPISEPQPIKAPSPPPKPQPMYSDEDIMAEVNCMMEEVVEAAVKEIADAGAKYATTAIVESSAQVESLVSEVLGQMLQEISSTQIKLEQERVAEEKRKLEEARRRQEHEAFLTQFSFSLCTEVIDEVLDETIKQTAFSEIQEALNEKAERVAKCTEQVCASLVEETLTADIALLVEDILEAELQRIHKYIKRWRDVVAVRRQLKRQMRGFPAAPCCVDPRFKLKALAPSVPAEPSIPDLACGLVNLGNAGKLAMSSTRLLKMRLGAIHQMRVHYFYQQLLDEAVWAPLDLPALVTENIANPRDRIFWKAIVLLPSDHESVASVADRVLSDWLEVKLGSDKGSEVRDEQSDGTMRTLCVTNTLQEKAQRTHKVHISVKASRGPLTDDGLSKLEECCELQGTGALIMLLPAMPVVDPGQDEQDVPLLSALLQLKQLQQVNAWHCPLPLVILIPGSDGGIVDTQKLEEALMLQTLMNEALISEYTFLFIPETTSDLQGSKKLMQAVGWLLARAPPPLSLSCQTLVQLVEAGLSREFSPRVYANRHERAAACLPPQGAAPVIQLYNAVLAHLADKVSLQDLSRLSWPPSEFCLPETQDFVPHLAWNSSQPLLMSQLENLLERVRLKFQYNRTPMSKVTRRSYADEAESVCVPYSGIPWDDLLVICIDHKLKDWQIPRQPVCEDAVTGDGEILVYFPTESLKGFQPPEEWTQAIRQTHREKQQRKEGVSAATFTAPSGSSLRQRLFHSLVESVEAPTPSLDITHTPTAQELLAHNVQQSLEEEKAESKRSLEQLQQWLDGDPLEHLTTPLFIPSSTLLSLPTTVRLSPRTKTKDAAFTQAPEPDELSEKAASPKTTPASMTWRLKELQRQILASREEELACRFKLSCLQSIVDD
ncbi:germinal-center associated nuclear protein isoform X2 [Parambassis ranga]|uniref:Germinal-center associated nuclear protein n=1 Tax=Parambassis ranga TaxID=210632 RepID=A0A6P7KIQ2_9TELE|nr:germinal-center associated nuclear protein isoform X2 [Parambassis ranga]